MDEQNGTSPITWARDAAERIGWTVAEAALGGAAAAVTLAITDLNATGGEAIWLVLTAAYSGAAAAVKARVAKMVSGTASMVKP